mmetsp:Transcript_16506/g.22904  ORF Transcript_16506/g.22904 Transcript_16506/m.22904 type:complete len:427 (-) Transcript_16506:85-1365(-)
MAAPNPNKEEAKATSKDQDQVQKLLTSLSLFSNGKEKDDDPNKPHEFWDTQPVPKLNEEVEEDGPIDKPKTVDDIQKEPYNLPSGFEWSETDVDDPNVMLEVYTLLTENYVEDDDNMFRFDYSANFLQWALKPPGYLKQWHIGVRVTKTKKLLGFISAIPAHLQAYDKEIKVVEINFLCVHKKLRDKRLAPVLIKEITRRVNLQNIWQAVYTAGRVLPKPVAQCRYYHRSLNPKKLIDVGFSHLGKNMTMARTIKLYKLPEQPQCAGIRTMEAKDVPSATTLLNTYLKKFSLKAHFSEEEVAHWFLPRENIINSYVIDDGHGKVTDLCSFYTLPSTIIGNKNYKTLKAAYAFYNVANTVPLEKLVKDSLIFAKKNDYDVYNCLDIMENQTFFTELKFGKGDGNLQYYLYNWKCPQMGSEKVGLVLL